MTSPFEAALTAIATAIEALTPPSDTGVTYHHWTARGPVDGASARRAFWFTPPAGGAMTEFGAHVATYRRDCELHLILTSTAETTLGLAVAIDDEALALIRAINNLTNYPAGVGHIEAASYRTIPYASDDQRVVIAFVVEAEET